MKWLALVTCAACGGGHTTQIDAPQFDGPTDVPIDTLAGPQACPSGPLLDVSPVDPAQIAAIAPIGTLGPPVHTLATDHTYIAGLNTASTAMSIQVTIPANGWIPQAARYSYDSGLVEYRFSLQPCREVVLKFDHVTNATPELVAALGSFDPAQDIVCTPIVAPDNTPGTWCEKGFPAPGGYITSGTVAGSSNVANAGQLVKLIDLGAMDTRLTPVTFANPARWGAAMDGFDYYHVACPYDYLPPTLRDQMLSLMGDAFAIPIERRTIEPRCGTVDVDVPNTAQGSWYLDPSQSPPPLPDEGRAIVLAHDHVNPTRGELSIGASAANVGVSAYYFTPVTSGSVNRPFSAIGVGGGVFCYENLEDRRGNPNGAGIVIIGLDDATTLRIERQSAASCGSGPWTFTSAATVFVR